jgi:hypothetical protein
VARLRQQVRAGKYEASPELVVAAMIGENAAAVESSGLWCRQPSWPPPAAVDTW